jgi:hypothetical protein
VWRGWGRVRTSGQAPERRRGVLAAVLHLARDARVLSLPVQRFNGGSLLGKVTRHVAFGDSLDLTPFLSRPAAARGAAGRAAGGILCRRQGCA